MAITISVKHDHMPEGQMIELRGICVVPNGGSVTLTPEQEARFNIRYPDGLSGFFTSNAAKTTSKSEGGDES